MAICHGRVRRKVIVVVGLVAAACYAQAQTPQVTIYGARPTDAGPLPGLLINNDQIPGNVQSADHEQIEDSRALNLGDFMETQLQGVSINDYSGNPFQMDVNYRGFTASPRTGTPVGLSVFFDGIRVNEPFGDVVQLGPAPVQCHRAVRPVSRLQPALRSQHPGGGAISVRTRSGFTSPGIEANVSGGSFGRRDRRRRHFRPTGTCRATSSWWEAPSTAATPHTTCRNDWV